MALAGEGHDDGTTLDHAVDHVIEVVRAGAVERLEVDLVDGGALTS